MGFRFRKSKNFGPFRVNLSKSGIGWSVGSKGVRYTKRADGKTQTTLNMPGTGISYVKVNRSNKNSSNTSKDNFYNANNLPNNNNDNKNKKPKAPFYNNSLFIWVLLFLLPPIGITLLWTSKKYKRKTRIALSTVFAFYTFILFIPNSNNSTLNNTTTQKNSISQESQNKAKDDEIAKQKLAAEEAEKQRIAQEKAATEEAEKQRIAQEKAAAEEAEKQRVAQEKAAAEEAERQKIAQEQAAVAEVQSQSSQEVQSSQPIGQTVYIASSGNGKKYHSNPNCSNMNGTIQLSVDDALNRGYTACKKCY
ncbi:DUF4236 domain-containing protein [Clostridium tertium]